MGRSNCSRVFVYSAVRRRASSQTPMAVAHKRGRGPLDQPRQGLAVSGAERLAGGALEVEARGGQAARSCPGASW